MAQECARARLRIGVVTAFPPGRNSLCEFGFHLVRHLVDQDEVADLVLFADRTAAGPPAAMRGVRGLPCWRFNDPRNAVRIAWAVRRNRPDAVLFNLQFATFGDKRLPGGLGLLTPALLGLLRVPTMVVLHNLSDSVDLRQAGFAGGAVSERLLRLGGRVLTRALLRADLVAVTIPRYVELLRERYGARNVVLAPHGSFDELPEPVFDPPPGPRRILAFGKWGTYKTVDVLVQAYQALRARGHDDLELVLAGPDSPNSPGYLAGVAGRFAGTPGLRFTGYVPEADVPDLFRSAEVVAFPYTSTTGSSGVLHQAGEFGRAVVLPRLGDLVDLIEDEGFRGVYFEPGQPGSLAGALAAVLDDPALRAELGRRNYAAATGVPMTEVVHWHLVHLQRLLRRRQRVRS